jgi:hypothetical protein
MNKFIRVFSYILMILGALIFLGGLGSGIAGLFLRGVREVSRNLPMARLALSGVGIASGLRTILIGLLVSGFGMFLHQVTEIVQRIKGDPKLNPVKSVRSK